MYIYIYITDISHKSWFHHLHQLRKAEKSAALVEVSKLNEASSRILDGSGQTWRDGKSTMSSGFYSGTIIHLKRYILYGTYYEYVFTISNGIIYIYMVNTIILNVPLLNVPFVDDFLIRTPCVVDVPSTRLIVDWFCGENLTTGNHGFYHEIWTMEAVSGLNFPLN